MFALVELGRLAGDAFEVLVETGEIVETALVAQLFDADAVVEEQFAGVADAELGEELGIGLARPGFEIPAKRIGDEPGDGGHVFQIDLLGKMAKAIVIDGVDPIVLRFGEVGAEADGGQ